MVVESYFKERFFGRQLDTSLYYRNIEKLKVPKISKADGTFTFGLFPNVVWDGDVNDRNTLFKNSLEWITETVEAVRQNPKINLIIRFHPGESTYHSSSLKLEEIIRSKIPDIDQIKNLKLISSDEKINTYAFIKENIDIGLVFDGMVGLELPFLETPAVLAAQGRNTGSDVAFEPKTKAEYLNLLSRPEDLISKFKKGNFRDNAMKYSYWSLFEHCYSLPILSDNTYCYSDLRRKAFDLDPATAPDVLKTIKYLSSYAGKKDLGRN
jgi:hypothetical protein